MDHDGVPGEHAIDLSNDARLPIPPALMQGPSVLPGVSRGEEFVRLEVADDGRIAELKLAAMTDWVADGPAILFRLGGMLLAPFVLGVLSSRYGAPLALIVFVALMILLGVLLARWAAEVAHPNRFHTLLAYDRRLDRLQLARAGGQIPFRFVKGIQVLRGVVDTPISNVEIMQVIVIADDGQTAERRLAWQIDGTMFEDENLRDIRAFGVAIGTPVEFYRIRGWRTPQAYAFKKHKLASGKYVEPLGESWVARGFRAFDSTAERYEPGTIAPLCGKCGYSLLGLDEALVCPECGANFKTNPTDRVGG